MYRQVNLKKKIKGDVLEKALAEAAKEIGLSVVSKDVFDMVYDLNSLKEIPVYRETVIRLKKGFIPIAEIKGVNKDKERDWFSIMNEFYIKPFGFGSKKKIEKYLSTVPKYIEI